MQMLLDNVFVLMLSLYLGKYSFTCFFFCVGVWNLVSHREVETQIKRASERHNNLFRSSCWTNSKADTTCEDPGIGQRMMTKSIIPKNDMIM